MLEFLFWSGVIFIVYTYVVFPLFIQLYPKTTAPIQENLNPTSTKSVTVVLVVFNEEKTIDHKINNLLAQQPPGLIHNIIVVSDGSTDNTNGILQKITKDHPQVKAIFQPENRGKAAGLKAALDEPGNGIIVFCDARQVFQPNTIECLLDKLINPNVGAVAGNLVFNNINNNNSAGSVGLYWQYETWIRANEAAMDSVIGCPGAIYAVRRELIVPPPTGLILDDLWIPLHVILHGKRVVFAPNAIAVDSAAENVGNEFKRKVRTLAGNFQLLSKAPYILLPTRNRLWWMYLSHKVFRLFVPYAMLTVLFTNACLMMDSRFYSVVFIGQVIFYLLALLGKLANQQSLIFNHRLFAGTYLFVSINYAAVVGLWYFFLSKERSLWVKH
ncbi:MAG: glycosyltransferase family 2 protein [Gammaproteobacteria bacterium]|nr:glycosyltransferase family 2 protein [Gammaproteobacteria bacterium]